MMRKELWEIGKWTGAILRLEHDLWVRSVTDCFDLTRRQSKPTFPGLPPVSEHREE